MSKSPSSSIFLPALGGAALLLGVAYGVANRGYGNDQIEALRSNFEAERAAVTAQAARTEELQSELTSLRASFEDQLAASQAVAKRQAQETAAEITVLRSQLGSESKAPETAAATSTGVAVSMPAPERGTSYGLGRPALSEEIAAWDVDVLPDGRGLPEGSGDVWTGEEVFADKCASCHGDFAEGRDAWPVLAGGFDTLADRDPVKTVGSYWPHLSTVWDYVHRSMPFGNAGTLTDDEVYAITAYILYSNNMVDDDFTLSRQTFAEVDMFNADGFVVDDRPSVEYTLWRSGPCMENCKDTPVQITRRSTDVGVTPADDGSMAESQMELELARLGGTEWGKERVAGSVFMGPGGVVRDEPEPTQPEGEQVASTDAAPASDETAADPALIAQGEGVFKKCQACHQVGDGARNRSGPQLNGVLGRDIGAVDGFAYSNAFKAAHDEGRVWDEAALAEFLTNPRDYFRGTKMAFRGLSDAADVEAVIAYLRTFE